MNVWSTWVAVALYLYSAGAPIVGLLGLWRSATSEARELAKAPGVVGDDGGEKISYSQMGALGVILVRTFQGRPALARRDLLLIGSGLLAGAAASILSLFI